jgi:YgiT-type zinc finger domain-containing protein
MKNTKCHFCGSEDFEERQVEYIYRRNGKYLIIRDMPCEVCLRCGERYYPAEALLAVESRFKAIHAKQSVPKETLAVPVESFALVAA